MPPKNEGHLDFSKMRFNVGSVPQNTDLVNHFQELSLYDEFSKYGGAPEGLPHRDNTIRYVLLAYDKGSPFQDIKTLPERNEKCLLEAGFKKTSDKWSEQIIDMVNGDIDEVNRMIRCFLFRIQDARKFNLRTAMEKALQDTIENIASPIIEIDADKKERAFKLRFENSQNALKMIGDLESLESEIFFREDVAALAKESDKDQSIFMAGAAERLAALAMESASTNKNSKGKK
jgi:hypothetical protein